MGASWECIDCNAQASTDTADSTLVALSRLMHELAGHRIKITGSDRNRHQNA